MEGLIAFHWFLVAVIRLGITVVVVLSSVLLAALESPAADPASVERTSQSSSLGYSSPREAFDAMRKAADRRDWRAVFSSLTPASQDAAFLELCYGCLWIEAGGEYGPFDTDGDAARKRQEAKLRATLKKYGLDSHAIDAAYARKYREMHGFDLKKFWADAERCCRKRLDEYFAAHPQLRKQDFIIPADAEEGSDDPEMDFDVLTKVALQLVANKAAFYEEAMELLTPERGRPLNATVLGQRSKATSILAPDYGDLQGLKITGDLATGWVTMTSYHLSGGVKVADPPQRLLRSFRRLNGRWYLDNLKGDFQPFEEKQPVTGNADIVPMPPMMPAEPPVIPADVK